MANEPKSKVGPEYMDGKRSAGTEAAPVPLTITNLTNKDILLNPGQGRCRTSGNKAFLKLVDSMLEEYMKLPTLQQKAQLRKIAADGWRIVSSVEGTYHFKEAGTADAEPAIRSIFKNAVQRRKKQKKNEPGPHNSNKRMKKDSRKPDDNRKNKTEPGPHNSNKRMKRNPTKPDGNMPSNHETRPQQVQVASSYLQGRNRNVNDMLNVVGLKYVEKKLVKGSLYTGTMSVSGDKPESSGTMQGVGYFANGNWCGGKLHGIATEADTDGVYRGSFAEGEKSGGGIYVTTHGVTYEGSWKKDKPNGWCKVIFNGGKSQEWHLFNESGEVVERCDRPPDERTKIPPNSMPGTRTGNNGPPQVFYQQPTGGAAVQPFSMQGAGNNGPPQVFYQQPTWRCSSAALFNARHG